MAEKMEQEEQEATPENAREIEEALAPFGVIKSATHGRIRLQLRREYRTARRRWPASGSSSSTMAGCRR
jgi:Ribonuclease G/E